MIMMNLMWLQADSVPESRRAAVFGIMSGIASSSFVFGNLSTRFLSTSVVFQVFDRDV